MHWWAGVGSLRRMDIFPEQDALIRELCEDPTITRELLTLQIQFFYSKDAEKDNDKIQRDIMPDIMRNSNLTIGRLGIMEKEEDAIESILHQDADGEAYGADGREGTQDDGYAEARL